MNNKEIKPTILKEINPDYLLEGLMLKLILWPPDVKSRLTGKTLMLGKIEGRRRNGRQRRWDGIIDAMDINLSKLQAMQGNSEALRAAVHGVTAESDTTWRLNNNKQERCLHSGCRQ